MMRCRECGYAAPAEEFRQEGDTIHAYADECPKCASPNVFHFDPDDNPREDR